MDDIRGSSLIRLYPSPNVPSKMLTRSQSISITSILKTLRVSLADIQPIDHNVPEIPSYGCSDPPYVIVGWTSQPFLANVELEFNDAGDGASKGQIITFEHWVEVRLLII